MKRPHHVRATCPVCGTEQQFVVLVRPGRAPPESIERECSVCETPRRFSLTEESEE